MAAASPRLALLLVLEEPDPDALPPGPILIPHQCRQDSGAHYAAGGKPGDRGVSSGDGGDQACGGAGQDRGDHGDHSGDRLVDQPAPAAKALDGKPSRWRDAGQVMSELGRMVEVVSPEPRNPFYVFKLFDSVLEHPVEGGEANEGERRQQYQAEGIERRADAGRGGDQPASDQPRGYRAEEDRCPAYPSADRRAPWRVKCSVVTNVTAAGGG